LIDQPGLSAEDIAKKAMKIAADICVYTNHTFTIESIDVEVPGETSEAYLSS